MSTNDIKKYLNHLSEQRRAAAPVLALLQRQKRTITEAKETWRSAMYLQPLCLRYLYYHLCVCVCVCVCVSASECSVYACVRCRSLLSLQ